MYKYSICISYTALYTHHRSISKTPKTNTAKTTT